METGSSSELGLDWNDPGIDRVFADGVSSYLESGDPDALAGIVRATESRLRAYLHLRCPDADAIDDLVQETYLRSFQKLDRLEDHGRLRAFLFGVARNVAREYYRKADRDMRIIDRYQREMAPVLARISEPDHGGEETSMVSRRQVLAGCMERLSEEHRTLLTRRYVDDVDASELSRQSGLSAGGMRTLLRRLRLQLQDCVRSQLALQAQFSRFRQPTASRIPGQ